MISESSTSQSNANVVISGFTHLSILLIWLAAIVPGMKAHKIDNSASRWLKGVCLVALLHDRFANEIQEVVVYGTASTAQGEGSALANATISLGANGTILA
jgi:hypothetical protein